MNGIYDVVSNPIPSSKLWITPKDEQDLYSRIEAMSATPEARAMAWNAVMFTFNYCNKLVEDEILSKEVFI